MSYRRPVARWHCTCCGAVFPHLARALAHALRAAWAYFVLGDELSSCWQVFTGTTDITAI